jgi:hypothetical protein
MLFTLAMILIIAVIRAYRVSSDFTLFATYDDVGET